MRLTKRNKELIPDTQSSIYRKQRNENDATLTFSQIFPTIDSLPASGLTPRLYDWSISSEHLGFLFFSFLH